MKLDTYTWQARILPATMLMLPIFIESNMILAKIEINLALSATITNLILFSFLVVISVFCRDLGKKKEKKLFKRWGGAPTTRFLRINNNEYNPFQKKAIKDYLKIQFNGIGMPTEKLEKEKPEECDLKYEAYVAELRSITRNSEDFKLLQSENRAYGMMRNMLGIKFFALFINVIIIIINIVLCVFVDKFLFNEALMVSSLFYILSCLFWLFFVTRKRVKNAADNYAVQLFDSALKMKAGK